MPSKNRLKSYFKGGFYHIYNRGVAKQIIFREEFDFKVFSTILEEALTQPPKTSEAKRRVVSVQGRTFSVPERLPKNFLISIELFAYCLMPNHFHLFIKQNDKDSIKGFMSSISTRYSMFFNKKYKRVGPLFQGRYKAVIIDSEAQMIHLSKYIHLNPQKIDKSLTRWYSSYPDYLGLTQKSWVKPNKILDLFSSKNNFAIKSENYKNFVEEEVLDKKVLDGKVLD